MSKLALIGAILLGLAFPATAAAQPVSSSAARHAVDHWWKGSAPHILWCAQKRYGTICGLRVSASKQGATIIENDHVWISRADGTIRVHELWATVRITVPLP